MPFSIPINQNVLEMEYAVRGPIPQRAAELKRQGMVTIPCNIGNPQALGQKPLTYFRQVLSLIEEPSKIDRERRLINLYRNNPEAFADIEAKEFISDYLLDFSKDLIAKLETGTGAYTDSNGPLFIREAVAEFINKRDGFSVSSGLRSKPGNIFLTNGASESVRYIIEMLVADKNDGVMIPIPQYPLYSATIRKCGGVQVNYYPDEDNGWALNREILEDSIAQAKQDGVNVKCIVVINPGNPTGAILDRASTEQVISFAAEHNLAIIADEVYQENVYGGKFESFAQLLGDRDVPLFSLHSTSKGFYGECGHRGGYVEVRNAPKIAGSNKSFTEILQKQASVSLCSNTVGQALVYLMVNPPEEGSEPFAQYVAEKESILNELFEKATMIKSAFEQMDGVECFGHIGAMYLFPRLNKLPPGTTDFDYCMNLLEKTGLTTVNGSGFGQKKGTHHLRIAFLPPKNLLEKVLPNWIEFHNNYVNSKN